MKVFLAFLLAPIAPIALFGPVLALLHGDLGAAGPVAFLCVVYGYPAELILGVPAYLLARRKGWVRWWNSVVAGAIVGVALPAVLLVPMALGEPKAGKAAAGIAGVTVVGAAMGAVIGGAFWLIGMRSSNNAFHSDGSRAARETRR